MENMSGISLVAALCSGITAAILSWGMYLSLSNFLASSYTASDIWETWVGSYYDQLDRWRVAAIKNPGNRFLARAACGAFATVRMVPAIPVILLGAAFSLATRKRAKKVEAE